MLEQAFYEELVAIRHHIHAHPELGDEEFETSQFLKAQLQRWGIRLLDTGLKTGIVAQIGAGQPVIALRADIDALPILEQTDLPYSSQNAGKMHACGHDLHQTSLLGAAKLLKEQEASLKGTIKLIFQHSEEIHHGAQDVLDTGVLDDVQVIIGYHNMPTLPVGQLGLRPEGIMAATDQFEVKLTGVGAHAAYPHESVDVIQALTHVVTGLNTIVARNTNPRDAVVLSVTHLEAGNTWNVLPDTAYFEGTLRTFDEGTRALAKQRFYELVEQLSKAYGVSAEIGWDFGANVTYNDPEWTAFLQNVSKTWHHDVVVPEASNAGEDFAIYQGKIPGVFAFIGSNDYGQPGLHFSDMTVKDDTLHVAVAYYVHSAKALLDKLGAAI